MRLYEETIQTWLASDISAAKDVLATVQWFVTLLKRHEGSELKAIQRLLQALNIDQLVMSVTKIIGNSFLVHYEPQQPIILCHEDILDACHSFFVLLFWNNLDAQDKFVSEIAFFQSCVQAKHMSPHILYALVRNNLACCRTLGKPFLDFLVHMASINFFCLSTQCAQTRSILRVQFLPFSIF